MPQETHAEEALRTFHTQLAARNRKNHYGVASRWPEGVRATWLLRYETAEEPQFSRPADGHDDFSNDIHNPFLALRKAPGTDVVVLGVEERTGPSGSVMSFNPGAPRVILGREDVEALRAACDSLLSGNIEER